MLSKADDGSSCFGFGRFVKMELLIFDLGNFPGSHEAVILNPDHLPARAQLAFALQEEPKSI
jgi:hypothetical protein